MSLILINLQSNQQIKLNNDAPLIIGRGNVIGCYDKRVSRNHGRITCTVDGKVRLAALHCNPCFFTRNGIPPVQQLNKDEEETLNEGDYLGLLPNAFWFKVTSNKEDEVRNQLENSATADVPSDNINQTVVIEHNTSNLEEVLVCKETRVSDNTEKDSSNLEVASSKATEGTSKKMGTPEFEKTRRLPLWMYQIDDTNESKSSNKHSLENATYTKEKKQRVLSETEIKKEFEMKSGDEVKSEKEVKSEDAPSTSRVEGENETTNLPCKIEDKANKTTEKEGYESGVDDETDLTAKRPICQYEGNCYRKNPAHKLEFCHPGDSDYTPYEERPLCQYGAACYRRNEKHKIEFRHPSPGTTPLSIPSPSLSTDSIASSPLPAKRTRKKISVQNFEDSHEYDLEDPFINDASSDEYIPSDLEPEEEEECLDTSREDD